MCSKMMRMMSMGNRPMIVRVLVLILMILVLIMSPLANFAEAHAAAEASAALHESIVQEFIAAILARSGVTFKNGGSLLSVAAMVYDDLKNADPGEMKERMDEFMESLNPANWNVDWNYAEQLANQMAIRVSPSVWQAICDSFNRLKTEDGSAVAGVWRDYTLILTGSDCKEEEAFLDELSNEKFHDLVINGDRYTTGIANNKCWTAINGDIVSQVKSLGNSISDYSWFSVFYKNYGGIYRFQVKSLFMSGYGSPDFLTGAHAFDEVFEFPLTLKISIPGDFLFTGDLAYPPDNTLVKVPDLPTVGADGAISMPDIPVLPEEYVVSDLPDTAGKVVTDLPFDVPIDIATGDSVVAGTDVPDVPDKPSDWPSNDDLSIPALIVSKFPFCIPFDVANMIGMLQAEPIEPVFHVPLKYSNVLDYDLVIDFSKFSEIIKIIRWGEQILFVAGLAYATRNYIKW